MSEVLSAYLPELVIFVFILFNIFGALFLSTQFYKLSKWVSLLGIVLAICSTSFLQIEPEVYIFNNLFLTNIYTVFFKILVLMSGFLITLLSRNMLKTKRERAFEFFAVFLAGLLFAMCAVSSVNFISLFVSIEGLGFICYLLLSFNNTYNSRDAAIGYFIQNSVAALLFLFGVSLVYGITSQFSFEGIGLFLNNINDIGQVQLFLTFAVLLIICTFLFKLGVVPFSSWLANTFESASLPICSYFSCIPVIVGIGVLARIMMLFLTKVIALNIIFSILAVLTILVASLSAIRQDNIKKLLAYSTSMQVGIMLLGLSVFSVYSLSSVLFYLFCYMFMNIGVWAAVTMLYDSAKIEKLQDLQGLIFSRPYFVIAFTMLLFSLAGLAPTTGFIAKLYVFSAVTRSGFVFLPFALIGLLVTVIMIYSYWRIIRAMFKRCIPNVEIDTHIVSSKFILYICAFVSIALCFLADKLIHLCQLSAYFI